MKGFPRHATLENIIKDFCTYLSDVQEKFPVDDDSYYDGAPSASTANWTVAEYETHVVKLEGFRDFLKKNAKRFPSDNREVRDALNTIYKLSRPTDQDTALQHVSTMIEHVWTVLRSIQPVDLDKLIQLMGKNQRAGDEMEGKDVVMLCGASGSGKTTTLHFLAGTNFEEVEVDGFFHLHPIKFKDKAVQTYETSSGGDPITRTIQTATVSVDGKSYVVCDTPSFAESGSIEEDIANGLGIVRAIHRSKSVRPTLVLSREGMGDRFSAFSETLNSVSSLFGSGSTLDLAPFNYVFTKYEERHKSCLCRQFVLIRKRPKTVDEGKVMFKSFVDDIIAKTTPLANIALPMESSPSDLLRDLVMEKFLVDRPREYFVPFVSEASLKSLKLQLQITLRDVMNALVEEDYDTTVYRMRQLSALGEVLPEAVECSQLGLEAAVRHASLLRERVMKVVEQLREAKVHKKYTSLLELLKRDMATVIKSEPLRIVCSDLCQSHSLSKLNAVEQLCMPQSCTSQAFCHDQIQSLTDMVCNDLPDFEPERPDMENLMRNRGSFLTAVVRLKEVSETLQGYPGADRAAAKYKEGFDRFYSFVDRVLSDAEENFQSSLTMLQNFERQAWFLAVLIQGFLNKPDSGGGEHEKMEELEHRRLKLMLRLEMKISDHLEAVSNVRLPPCAAGEELSGSILALKRANVDSLQAPQKFLLAVAEVPRLCKFLPSKIDPEEAKRTSERLNASLVEVANKLTMRAEEQFDAIRASEPKQQLNESGEVTEQDEFEQKHKKSPVKLKEEAKTLRADVEKILVEIAVFRAWSTDLSSRTENDWTRLEELMGKVDGIIVLYDQQIAAAIEAEEAEAEALRKAQSAGCGFLPTLFCA